MMIVIVIIIVNNTKYMTKSYLIKLFSKPLITEFFVNMRSRDFANIYDIQGPTIAV